MSILDWCIIFTYTKIGLKKPIEKAVATLKNKNNRFRDLFFVKTFSVSINSIGTSTTENVLIKRKTSESVVFSFEELKQLFSKDFYLPILFYFQIIQSCSIPHKKSQTTFNQFNLNLQIYTLNYFVKLITHKKLYF